MNLVSAPEIPLKLNLDLNTVIPSLSVRYSGWHSANRIDNVSVSSVKALLRSKKRMRLLGIVSS